MAKGGEIIGGAYDGGLLFDEDVLNRFIEETTGTSATSEPEVPIGTTSRPVDSSRVVGQVTIDLTEDDMHAIYARRSGAAPSRVAEPVPQIQEDSPKSPYDFLKVAPVVSEQESNITTFNPMAASLAGLAHVASKPHASSAVTALSEESQEYTPVRRRKKHPFIRKMIAITAFGAYGVCYGLTGMSRAPQVAETNPPVTAALDSMFSWENLNPLPGMVYGANLVLDVANGAAESAKGK